MDAWESEARAEAAALWSVAASEVEIKRHPRPRVPGLQMYAAVQRDANGSYTRYAPGVVEDGGARESDPVRARARVLTALGVGTDAPPKAHVAARCMSLLIPHVRETGRIVTDPEREAYYAEHFGIQGVVPPALEQRGSEWVLDFWISPGDIPARRAVVTLRADGTAPVELTDG